MPGRILTRLPAIETPRLWVRELVASDVHDFAAYMLREDYQRQIAARHGSVESLRGFVLRAIAGQEREARTSYHLAAVLKSCGAAVADGFIIPGADGAAEVGWGVHPALWGQGIGSELARALIAAAFERLGAQSVWCKVMSGNAGSLRVARKSGLKPWKTNANYPIGGGRTEKVIVFSGRAQDYFDAPY